MKQNFVQIIVFDLFFTLNNNSIHINKIVQISLDKLISWSELGRSHPKVVTRCEIFHLTTLHKMVSSVLWLKLLSPRCLFAYVLLEGIPRDRNPHDEKRGALPNCRLHTREDFKLQNYKTRIAQKVVRKRYGLDGERTGRI